MTMDAINRRKKNLLESGDSNLFLREGDKQVKISLGNDNERIWMEKEVQLAQNSLRVYGLRWQGPYEPGNDRCSVVSFIAQQRRSS